MFKKLTDFAESLVQNSKDTQLLAIDIGSSSIKLAEIDLSEEKPVLKSLAVTAIPGGVFNNNEISDTQEVANLIKTLIAKTGTESTKVAFCLPGPAAFVKRMTTGFSTLKEFDETISFEAANYIPDDLTSVRFDYQVLRHDDDKKSMDVLLVAVKNEIVDSFLQAINLAGLQPVIADIDYFPISNIFEINYPEVAEEKSVAIIEVGARYARVCILEKGVLLFSGDIAAGSKVYNEVLKDQLGLNSAQAESVKAGNFSGIEGVEESSAKAALEAGLEQLATELNRQMKFFIGAAELSGDLDEVYLTGGALQVDGLAKVLSEKMNKPCHVLDPVTALDVDPAVSTDLLDSQKNRFSVCLGMAYRRLADKKHAIE